GRKVRAPENEETGVETYSFLWGRQRAVAAWLSVTATTAACAYAAAREIHATRIVLYLLLPLFLGCVLASAVFLAKSKKGGGKVIEAISGVWALLTYLSLGALPVWLRWYGGQR